MNVVPLLRVLSKLTVTIVLSSALLARGQSADVRDGLASYWPLEFGDGGVALDVASVNSMNIIGTPAITPGRFGNAFTFDGLTTYLTNLHAYDNSFTDLPIYNARTYTISMWVRGPAQQANYLFSHGSTASTTPLFIMQSGQAAANSAKFNVIIRNDAGTALVDHRVSTNIVFDNTWHHIAWVDDRGTVRLYIDGNLDPANFSYVPAGNFSFNTTCIGSLIRTTVSTGAIFDGQIDDVAIWDRALTQSEVQSVMTNSLTVPSLLITKQPAGGTRAIGDRITFRSRGAGTQPISYQWFKDNVEITGATSRNLTLSNLAELDSGSYTVQMANDADALMSAAAILTVLPDPAPDVRSGLVSYWPMNVTDAGANPTPDIYSHNDMRLVPPSTFTTLPSPFGTGINLDGASQYGVRSGGFPIYNNTAFSVSLWVYGGPQGDRRFFCESTTNGNNNPLFAFGSHSSATNPAMRVFIRNNTGGLLLDRFSTRPVLDSNWHHVVWTETNGLAKLYIDGELDESDFTYIRGPVFVDQTAVGAIVRAAVGGFFAGAVDELAVWNRPLTFTEIQEIRTAGVPEPLGAIKPEITQHPVSRSVLTRSRVTFTFTATGTSPLEYLWRKGGTPLPNQTNDTLTFRPVTLEDAGDYDVIVSNAGGSVTSRVATLTVTLRPPPPGDLAVDFNNTDQETPAETQPGFLSFAIPSIGGSGPFTRSYGGADVTLFGAGTGLSSRRRTAPVDTVSFTDSQLLRDFIFATDNALGQGLDLTIEFLEPNKHFAVTLWSFDTSSTGNRVSDWTVNDVPVVSGYTFNGSVPPADNNTYRINFNTVSDGDGKILIQGRRNPSATAANNVFLNAVQLTPRHIRILSIQRQESALVLTVRLLNPEVLHRLDFKTHLNDQWDEHPAAFFDIPQGDTVQIIVPTPQTNTEFYRIVETP